MIRCLPDHILDNILDTIGPREQSIEYITSRLYKLCPDAVDSGKMKAGGVIINPLTDIQTIVVQKNANISASAMISINRTIRSFQPGLQSIFASYKAVKKIYDEVSVRLEFQTFKTSIPSNSGIEGDYEDFKIDYSHANLFDTLNDHLDSMSRSPQFNKNSTIPSIGIELGEEGLVLALVIMGDHGGGVMSFLSDFICFEGAGQKYNSSLGEFEGKETHFTLENTIIPHIAIGLEKCSNSYALILEWAEGFDYVLVPKCAINTENKTNEQRRSIPGGIEIVREIGSNKLTAFWEKGEEIFKREDIPNNYSVKCLPIVAFSAGDIAYLMMLYGREDFKSNKCVHCLLSRTLKDHNWQLQENSRRGTPITNEIMQSEINQYILANSDKPDDMSLEEFHQLQAQSASDHTISGINSKSMLLPQISVARTMPPVLHILLGITNYLNDYIVDFITEKIEPDLKEIVDKKAILQLTKNTIREIESNIER